MLMCIEKKINQNKRLFSITAVLTVITLIFYLFLFSLPHDLHSSVGSDSSALTKLLEVIEKSHHDEASNDSNTKDNEKQGHNQDDCPICNLSYFNSLYASESFTNYLALQEANEKPVYLSKTGFSSFTYYKFFLRSPPSFIS